MAVLAAAPALGAFPGRNGMLAVTPLHGAGLLLTNSRGADQHRICPQSGTCPVAMTPRWSPDGQAITFSSPDNQGVSIVYDDGSCLDCQQFGVSTLTSSGASAPAFTSTPGLLSAVFGGNVIDYGSDGLQKLTVLSGHVSDAVWSAQGELAAVRSERVLAGRPGHLHSLGRGTSPSWAPGGARLALVRRGWVTVVRLGHHSDRRLAKGSAPAFSPDGRWIAFIGRGSRLSVVASDGGHVHRVGDIQGRYVDWQPVIANHPSCTAPPGSTIVASSATGIVTSDSGPTPAYLGNFSALGYMGCLFSTGRERLLTRYDFQSIDGLTSASGFVTIGNLVALLENWTDDHYGGSSETVRVFDLSSGAQSQSLGGQQASCADYDGYGCYSQAGQLVMNADGFTAVHTTVSQLGAIGASGASTTEQIVAVDSTGAHVEDTITLPESGPPPAMLTDLQLSGDTLTWLHDGSSRTTTLQ